MLNYDREMQKIISSFNGKKPSLLLHACCAPCASACIERIKDLFDITVWFYNPNINSYAEYVKRGEELKRLCEYFDVKCEIADFDQAEFYSCVKGLENEPECGARCLKCYELRLDKTAKKCVLDKYDYFTTTLTVSPLKSAETLNVIGERVANANGCEFLPSDFKKKGGFLRSVELSKTLNLYRQNYCGCVFSTATIIDEIK